GDAEIHSTAKEDLESESALSNIGEQESPGVAKGSHNGFRGQVAATDSAFHGGGPSGSNPVACEEKIRNRSGAHRPLNFQARTCGKSSSNFFHHMSALERRRLDSREKVLQLFEREFDHLSPWRFGQTSRGADDKLYVSSFMFVEHPLDGAVEKCGMRQIRHL